MISKAYKLVTVSLLAACLAGCAQHAALNPTATSTKPANHRTVKATWYGVGDGSGKHTANGERFNTYGLTIAHKHLPFDTQVRVTHPKTQRSVVARVNDRGPFVKGIELDLTKGTANAIGMSGTQAIHMEVLGKKSP